VFIVVVPRRYQATSTPQAFTISIYYFIIPYILDDYNELFCHIFRGSDYYSHNSWIESRGGNSDIYTGSVAQIIVSHEYETWSFTLREMHRLRAIEGDLEQGNQRICWLKRNEVTKRSSYSIWGAPYFELFTKYYSGKEILIEKAEGSRALGRYRCRWEENIKMKLQKLWCVVVGWTHLAQDRLNWLVLVNMATNQSLMLYWCSL
jgi:hypothetical protein